MDTARVTESAVADWLASSLDKPLRAHVRWAEDRVAVLPLGRNFCVIRLSESVVQAATSSTTPETISDALSEMLDGPVICDPVFRRYYALVPPSEDSPWPATADTQWVGAGTVVGVPDVSSQTPGDITYWSVPVVSPHALCDPGLVRELALVGEQRLADSL